MRCFFGLVLLAGFFVHAHAGDSLLLGVLEEPQDCSGAVKVHVRPLFAKHEGVWRALDTREASAGLVPRRGTWMVSFDGKKVGEVETEDLEARSEYGWTSARDRSLKIITSTGLVEVPNLSKSFGGWCATPVRRPLVLVANGSPLDREDWKVFTPSSEQVNRLFADFQVRVGKTNTCSDPNAEKYKPFNYGFKDVQPLRSYRNNKGQILITLALKPRKDRCDGPDDAWGARTFLVGGAVTYIGADLTLVDAGDYDGDGVSELVFWFSGYNKDGYILFSPAMAERTEYLWGYH